MKDEDKEKREELVEAIIADTDVPISESGKTRYSIGNLQQNRSWLFRISKSK